MSRKIIVIPEKTWSLICGDVMNAVVRRPIGMGEFKYYWTFRLSGGTAPSDLKITNVNDLDSGNAQKLFDTNESEILSNSYPVDFYIWAFNVDADNSDNSEIIFDS